PNSKKTQIQATNPSFTRNWSGILTRKMKIIGLALRTKTPYSVNREA
ncbi:MAG: hypothetical protein ACJAY8_001541, partial [Sphingobacteriales bacterium]